MKNAVNQKFKQVAPLIAFFSLPAPQQIAVLPRLKGTRKYDFPDGDLTTDNVLEILLNVYAACLNALSVDLLILFDESDFEDAMIPELLDEVDELLAKVYRVVEWNKEDILNEQNLDHLDWTRLRQFSEAAQQQWQIQVDISSEVLKSCMDDWLHP